ncbi:MAG: glycoside hydrolase 43 family protein [Bacteroidaceae bacterium]|nr:glycoside hydrolase 43 family protein [Bacteroidaceae bacterium]
MKRFSAFVATMLVFCATMSAQETLKPFSNQWTADQGDGTYINPIVNADFPDCDVIRVGDTYYFVGTTMYHFPGATILKSKDLVNWEFCANPLERINSNDAYNLLNGKHHYSQGQWAASLKYHDGKFYLYFICYGRSGVDDTQNILLTATDPEGLWSMVKMSEHYYDSGWMFDDGENGDGYLYVACGIGDIWVNKLDPVTLQKISSQRVISVGNGCEGSHMYHIGDYYYIYATYGGTEGSQTIFRAKKPMGPYEEHKGRVFEKQRIHQGALVETQTGEWWTVLFKDNGAIGRIPYLEPVVWKDGWPIIGNNGIDVSRNSKPYRKPDVGATYPKTYLPTNDPFVSPTLGKQWEWNHNPVNKAWSLTERPGHLRLYTASVTDHLVSARNSITQRIIGLNPEGTASNRYSWCYGTAKMDVSGMQEGDVAGLSVFQTPYSFIAVKVQDGKKIFYGERCTFNNQNHNVAETKNGIELTSDVVYLRAMLSFGSNTCRYQYSYDNKTWRSFGVSMTMGYTLDFFVGQRFYLFNYATKALGGHVDFDWFSTEKEFTEEDFYAPETLAQMAIPQAGEERQPDELFSLKDESFVPDLYLSGNIRYMSSASTFTSGRDGFGGWHYPNAIDVSPYNYLVINLLRTPACNAVLKVYDQNTLWMAEAYEEAVKTRNIVVDLRSITTPGGRAIDPSHLYTVGFQSDGSSPIYIKEAFLSMDGVSPATDIQSIAADQVSSGFEKGTYFTIDGRRLNGKPQQKGFYILDGKKYWVK